MRATLDDNRIVLSFTYHPAVVAFVRSLPGRIYEPTTRTWRIPVALASGALLQNLEKLGFLVDPAIFDALQSSDSLTRELEGISTRPDAPLTTSLPLLPAQRAVTAWMVQSGGGINRCPVRSGKTYMALATAEILRCQRILWIAPKSTLYQFQAKVKELLPAWEAVVVDGNQSVRAGLYRQYRAAQGPAILIVSYDLARIDYSLLKDLPMWDAIFCDEIHHLKTMYTKTRKTIRQYPAKHRYGLTATPIHNSAPDVYSLIDWCFPGSMGSYKQFLEYFTMRNSWGAVTRTVNTDELAHRIARYMIHRPMADFTKDISPITIDDVPFDLSEKERKLYDQLLAELLFDVEKSLISKVENPVLIQMVLVKSLRLLELCDSLELLGEDTTSTKLEILREKLEDCLVDGQKAAIFSRFKRMVKILERELAEYNPVTITGDKTGQDRSDAIDQFQNDPHRRIVISTDAGGEGISLAAANFVFNYDLPYSYGKFEQRIGRPVLMGKTAPIAIFNLIARKSMDEKVARIIARKQDLSDLLLKTGVSEMFL